MKFAISRTAGILFALAAVANAQSSDQPSPTDFKFSFGSSSHDAGVTAVAADTVYTPDRGYGFEPYTMIPAPGVAIPTSNPSPILLTTDNVITSNKNFFFSVKLPEGNYRVTLTLGDKSSESTTTVKAEARRLMLERIHLAAGQFATRTFTVNIRTGAIEGGGSVKLDPREIGSLTWDDKLTLQFTDAHPAVAAMEIHKVTDAVTVFLCSDSTVTDQPREPYGTWGMMLPRWFDDHVAIANYGESGLTVKGFTLERRWQKVMSVVKPGDYVFMQFGHNDLNKKGHNGIWPAPDGDWAQTYSEPHTDYKKYLEQYAAEVKSHGAIPVIVTPMTKITFGTGEINAAGLGDYPKCAAEAATEAGVAMIDLNAMSVALDTALGTTLDRRVYVEGLHQTSYGGYLFARCILEGIRQNKLALAADILPEAGTFDPAHPDMQPDDFKLPLEARVGGGFGGFGRRGGGTTRPATVPARGG